jgi:hypothetical protein
MSYERSCRLLRGVAISPPPQLVKNHPRGGRTQPGFACARCRAKKLAVSTCFIKLAPHYNCVAAGIEPAGWTVRQGPTRFVGLVARSLSNAVMLRTVQRTIHTKLWGVRQLAELQMRLKQHDDTLQHLRSASDGEALATLEWLRAINNVREVLSLIRSSRPPHCQNIKLPKLNCCLPNRDWILSR